MLARMLGIVPQILNFEMIKQQHHRQHRVPQPLSDVHTRRQFKPYWMLLSIAICIAFTCGYPYSVVKLLQNPTNGKKGVNYFITYIYYGAKYFVTLIIYCIQFWNNKQFHSVQTASLTMYERLHLFEIDNYDGQCWRPFLIGYRFEKREHMSINAWNVGNFIKTIVMIVGYIVVSYLKLVHIFHTPIDMNAFDLSCYYYPNIFICLYVTQFYIAIQQQVFIFGKLNNVLENFMEELSYYGMRDPRRSGRDKRCIERRQSITYAVDKLDELIEMHDALRRINAYLENMNSLQLVAIIINAFMNTTSEVYSTSLLDVNVKTNRCRRK